MSLQKNIYLAYFLSFFARSWFWLGVWVFYYLQFTSYSGIGALETVLILTMTLAEIPSGAVADLLGKKWTLIIAFLFQSTGMMILGVAPAFLWLGIGIFVAALGGTLYSGTIEALVYDSLLSLKDEKRYDKVIANMRTLELIAPAIFSIIGGVLYTISPGLPFIASGIGYFAGMVFSLFLAEPPIDTDKFSLKVFIEQNKRGLQQLTKSASIKSLVILLLSIGTILVILEEMLNDFLAVEFGFTGQQLAVLWSLVFVVSAAASQATPFITKRFKPRAGLILVGSLIGLTLIASPWLGLIVGGVTLVLRTSLMAIFNNITSLRINTISESRYRATTLSTFNMMKNIPYLFAASIIGYMSDLVSARITALALGVILLVLLGAQYLRNGVKEKPV